MTLKDLREEAWDIAREVATIDIDRLWSTREMNRYINRVYRYVAKETRCILDSETISVCQIDCPVIDYTTLTPGTLDYQWAHTEGDWLYHANVCAYKYPLHESILDLEEVKWTTRQWRLTKVSVKKWQPNPYWEKIIGMPTEYATDLSNKILAVNFRADTSDTLRLQVRRLPLVDLIGDNDVPEFRTNYHDLMVNGILEQMYLKQDVEAFDLAKAKDYHDRFMNDVDEIKQQEIKLDSRLRPNNSMDGFR